MMRPSRLEAVEEVEARSKTVQQKRAQPNPAQVFVVIKDPKTAEGVTSSDGLKVSESFSLAPGIRSSSPPPLVPISRPAKAPLLNVGHQLCTTIPIQISESNFTDIPPLQSVNRRDAAKRLLLEKNQVLSNRGHRDVLLSTGQTAKKQLYPNTRKEVRIPLSFPCKFCSKSCRSKKVLHNHQYICPKNPRKRECRVECPHCHKTYARKAHLDVHLNSNGCKKVPANRRCSFSDCNFKYRFRTVFMDHLKDKHNVNIEPGKEMLFDDWTQFFEWKDAEEARTYSYYSQQFGKKNNRAYFYCQHDGPSKSRDKTSDADDQNAVNSERDISKTLGKRGRRGPNQKGKIKNGKICFSMIHVHGVNKEGKLRVTYFPTHSHELNVADLKFQPANAATRQYIRQQIAKGVSPEKISEQLKEEKFSLINNLDVEQETILRSDFISLHALRERKRLYSKSVNCLDAATSAQELVDNLRKGSYDPVLIFKPAGGRVVTGPDSAMELPRDTFILGIQTKEQLEIMKECCKVIVIIDVIHDVTRYGCKLLNVVGVDEMNKGYPVAHCISSNLDEETLRHFFGAIRERIPDLLVKCALTEGLDPPYHAIFNAVRAGFVDSSMQHLVCIWTFLRSLQQKLRARIHDDTLTSTIFEDLCGIVLAKSECEFDQLLAAFRRKYAELKSSSFMRYFSCLCVPKKDRWAMCFRRFPHKNIETTMFAESFHDTLRDVYLKQNLNKTLDTLVNVLIQTGKEYYARRWTIGIFSSPCDREAGNEQVSVRHGKSVALSDDRIVELIEGSHWEVTGQNSERVFQVIRCSTVCTNPSMCYFRCTSETCSDLCVHLYVCTCKDEYPLCEHIHKVHSMNVSKGTHEVWYYSPYHSPAMTFDEGEESEDEEIHREPSPDENTFSENTSESRSPEEEEILTMWAELREHIESSEVEELYPHILQVLSELNEKCQKVRFVETGLLEQKRKSSQCTSPGTEELQKKRKIKEEDAEASGASDEESVIDLKQETITPDFETPCYVEVSLPDIKHNLVQSNSEDETVSSPNPSTKAALVGDKHFTPPIDYVNNPNQEIFKLGDERFTLVHIKSLEPWLPPAEVNLLQKASDGKFEVGCLAENVINSYLSLLAGEYVDFCPLASSVIQSLLCANKATFKTFWEGLRTQKVIFVPMKTNHWTSVAVLVDEQTIIAYDPLQLSAVDAESLNTVKRGLAAAFPDKPKWTLMKLPGSEQDVMNCGVNICVFAQQVARADVHYQTASEASAFRRKIYDSIIGHCLKREAFNNSQCEICKESVRTGAIGTVKCVQCSQPFHRMCLQLEPNDICVCPLIVDASS